jgi:hypothetical protein
MKGFCIYYNNVYSGFIVGRSKKAVNNWLSQNVLSTHVGALKKTDDGYIYLTSIGRTYTFTNGAYQEENR